MEQMEYTLLASTPQGRRMTHVLHSLSGIGKTQPAIAYARKHQKRYTAILFLNGNGADALRQSLAAFGTDVNIGLTPVPTGKSPGKNEEVDEMADAVLRWLSQEDNTQWCWNLLQHPAIGVVVTPHGGKLE